MNPKIRLLVMEPLPLVNQRALYLVVNIFGRRFSISDDVIEVSVIDDQNSAGFQHLAEVADRLCH